MGLTMAWVGTLSDSLGTLLSSRARGCVIISQSHRAVPPAHRTRISATPRLDSGSARKTRKTRKPPRPTILPGLSYCLFESGMNERSCEGSSKAVSNQYLLEVKVLWTPAGRGGETLRRLNLAHEDQFQRTRLAASAPRMDREAATSTSPPCDLSLSRNPSKNFVSSPILLNPSALSISRCAIRPLPSR